MLFQLINPSDRDALALIQGEEKKENGGISGTMLIEVLSIILVPGLGL